MCLKNKYLKSLMRIQVVHNVETSAFKAAESVGGLRHYVELS